MVGLDPSEGGDTVEDLVGHLEAEPVEEERRRLTEVRRAEHEVAETSRRPRFGFDDGLGAGVRPKVLARAVVGTFLRRRQWVRCPDVDHDAVLEDRVDAAQRRAFDGGPHAHRTDPTGDVGQVLFGLAAHVQRREVAVRALGNAQLHLTVGGAEHTVVGAAQTAPLPERGQLGGVGHAEFDVEQPVERHQAPTLA